MSLLVARGPRPPPSPLPASRDREPTLTPPTLPWGPSIPTALSRGEGARRYSKKCEMPSPRSIRSAVSWIHQRVAAGVAQVLQPLLAALPAWSRRPAASRRGLLAVGRGAEQQEDGRAVAGRALLAPQERVERHARARPGWTGRRAAGSPAARGRRRRLDRTTSRRRCSARRRTRRRRARRSSSVSVDQRKSRRKPTASRIAARWCFSPRRRSPFGSRSSRLPSKSRAERVLVPDALGAVLQAVAIGGEGVQCTAAVRPPALRAHVQVRPARARTAPDRGWRRRAAPGAHVEQQAERRATERRDDHLIDVGRADVGSTEIIGQQQEERVLDGQLVARRAPAAPCGSTRSSTSSRRASTASGCGATCTNCSRI